MIFRANYVHTMDTQMDPCGEFWALVQRDPGMQGRVQDEEFEG